MTDREIAEEFRIWLVKENIRVGSIDFYERIVEILRTKERETIERLVEVVDKLDPLEAECNWDNSEDIAEGVKKFIAKVIRQLE